MIFDSSVVLKILKDKNFFERLKEGIDEEVKMTSITAYELLRGAAYIRLRHGREYELNMIRGFMEDTS